MSEKSPKNPGGNVNQYNRPEMPKPAEAPKKKKISFIWYILAGLSLLIIGGIAALVLNRPGKDAVPSSSSGTDVREVWASASQAVIDHTEPDSQAASQETTPSQATETQPPVTEDRFTIALPYSPGGITDQLARALREALEKELGCDIVVRNDTGTSNWNYYKNILNSDDGTLIGFVGYPVLVKEYLDPENKAGEELGKMTNIADVFHDPSIIVVRADSPFNTLQDLIDAGKETDLKISVTGGWGYDDNALVCLINKACNTRFTMVEEAQTTAKKAVLEGTVDAQATNISYLCRSNDLDKLKVLAVFDEKASSLLPGAVLVDETGIDELKGLYVSRDIGMISNNNMSQETADRIAAAVEKISTDKLFLKAAVDLGFSVRILKGEDFSNYVEDVEAKLKSIAYWSTK